MGRLRCHFLVSRFSRRLAIVAPHMSDENHRVPEKSGSAGLVALGVILLLAAGGLVLWKVQGGAEDDVVVAPPAPAPIDEPPPVFDNAPPPPPEEVEEEPEAEPEKKAVKSVAPVVGGCGGPCNGEATAEIRNALAMRGGMARTCYNNALRRNSTLEGKMTVAVRISGTGSVCSANVTSDTSGDAALVACVATKFRAAQFPAPTGGCVDAAVPLNFMPKKE